MLYAEFGEDLFEMISDYLSRGRSSGGVALVGDEGMR
jgi:hypothetical protein